MSSARVAADVLEQPPPHLAVPPQSPSRRQCVRPPRSSARRSRSVSKGVGPCGPRYQSRAFQPIVVGSSVGRKATEGSRCPCRLQVLGEHVARAPAQRHLDGAIGRSPARASRAVKPAHQRCPPRSPGPNRPASAGAAGRAGDGELLDRPAEPSSVVSSGLRADPRPARPPAHQPPLDGQRQQHPARHADLRPRLSGWPGVQARPRRQHRDRARELARRRLAPTLSRLPPALPSSAACEPDSEDGKGTPQLRDHRLGPPALQPRERPSMPLPCTIGTSSTRHREHRSAASRASGRGSGPRTAPARRRPARRSRCPRLDRRGRPSTASVACRQTSERGDRERIGRALSRREPVAADEPPAPFLSTHAVHGT